MSVVVESFCEQDIQCLDTTWLQQRIRAIDTNDFAQHDLLWCTAAAPQCKDYVSIYARQQGFLSALMRHGSRAEGVMHIELSGYLKSPLLLRFLRVYCHTGVVLLQHNEPFQQLYDKYQMTACYDLQSAADVLIGALAAKMDSAGCVQALLDLCGTELYYGPVGQLAEQYFKRHVHDCLRQFSSTFVRKLQVSQFMHILKLLDCDDVNANEKDLLEEVYVLLTRRYKSEFRLTSMEQELAQEEREGGSPVAKRHRAEAAGRALQVVRVPGLSYEDLMAFKEKHPTAFAPDFYMQLFARIYDCARSPCSQELIRKHVPSSAFPRTLALPSTLQGSHVVTTLQALDYSVSFLAVPWYKQGGTAEVPPFLCAGHSVITMTVVYSGSHMHARGMLNNAVTTTDSSSSSSSSSSSIELRVINFSRDRIKKHATACNVEQGKQFQVPKIILISTLDNDYTFAPHSYPNIQAGSHVLIKVTCRRTENIDRQEDNSIQ